VAYPTVPDNGVYTGGVASSGLPVTPDASPMFTLTFDVAPGTYNYYCDVHNGMTGQIIVVPDDQPIPSPTEAQTQGLMELGKNIGQGIATFNQEMAATQDQMVAGADGATVEMGKMAGMVSIDAFFPYTVTIQAGQSVTWTMEDHTMELHTVTSLPLPSEDEEFLPQAPQGNNPPVILLGPVAAPSTPSGSTVHTGDSFNSGLMMAGKSYTLTFADPGVYPYGCFLHDGMLGVVVVLPATNS
jgi:plastocyanin